MKRVTKYRYQVGQREVVTIRANPIGVGPHVTVTNNGATVKKSGDSGRPTFKIVIDQVPKNSHFVIVECSFLESDPADTRFDVEITGSRGGMFKDISIKKANIIWDPEFTFTVA